MSDRVIADRYEVEALLGEGGFGTVHRAFDRVLHRAVAIKLFGDRRRPDRIIAEARAVARLAHPAIVAIHDVGSDGDQPYLVMELVPGESLRVVLRRGPIDRATANAWLRAIADALATAHAAGIVHLDIKPENVLVSETKQVKVVDFGLARTVDTGDAIVPSRIAGTLRYMAPEQLAGEPVDARADQYAWAVLAFEMLATIHPRDLRRDVDDQTYALAEHPPRLHEVVPASSELAAVVARAMAKRAEHRFASMAELIRAWDDAVDRPAVDESIAPSPQLGVTVDERPPERRRRSSRHLVILACALAGLVGAAVLAATLASSSDSPSRVALAVAGDAAPVAPTPDAAPVFEPAPAPVPVSIADAATEPAKARRRLSCKRDGDCRKAERCRDGVCIWLPFEMPWKYEFSPKPIPTTCDGGTPTCGQSCARDGECGARGMCYVATRIADGRVESEPGVCRECQPGHVYSRHTGNCEVPCEGERDCPIGFECSDHHGRTTCWIE